jgi:hypothetical protein
MAAALSRHLELCNLPRRVDASAGNGGHRICNAASNIRGGRRIVYMPSGDSKTPEAMGGACASKTRGNQTYAVRQSHPSRDHRHNRSNEQDQP